MEQMENNVEKIDLFFLLTGFWRTIKRIWLPGLLTIIICTAAVTLIERQSYQPKYEASATFTVKVVNPLYASASGYNAETAEQMENTFPYILSSNALQENVKRHLGVTVLPNVTAEVISGTNIFTLSVQDSDPQRAYDVLNAVINCYPTVAEFVIGPTNMVMLDESGVPTYPTNSYSLRNSLAKGGVLGVLLVMVVALMIVLTNNTVHNEDDLKHLLNVPCLGMLPATKVVGRGVSCPLIHQDHGRYGFSESVQLLGVHLEKELKEKESKVVLVSSAGPGEGKTTTSANLGIALAQKGNKVLLMDCDLRNPSLAKAFQLINENGLADLLEDRVTTKDIVKETEISGLYVVVGGKSQKFNPEDLLANERLRRLLENTKKNFDYIILDTSPCGLLADASEVADLAECALMVVRQDYASRNNILDGAKFLTDSKLPLIGSVLNGVEGHSGRYGYGYYGYGYSYGYGYGSSKNS